MNLIKSLFGPAPHKPRIDDHLIKKRYTWMRMQMLSSTFIGYATFYIVRNNFSTVAKDVGNALQYDKSTIGNILAVTAIAYGLGKLFMGALSDQSNPRKFMAFGLLMTAFCNFAFGASSSAWAHMVIWTLNGFIQGMGWGPCGRTMGHWFSVSERGLTFAWWNISHNVGGGIAGLVAAYTAQLWGWQSAFYIPGIIACFGSVYLFLTLRDTPQSEGLPPIEEYKNDYPLENGRPVDNHEEELKFKEIFCNYILNNKMLWVFAMANFFVYIVRYSMLDWGPTYLREVKGASISDGGIAVAVIEFGGIPSTLLIGWFSDKVGGRRGMVSLLCMIPIIVAFVGIMLNPIGHLWLDMTLLAVVGFFVYPPVMLLGVAALDLTSKKAVGAAAGFVGLFGYIGRTVQAKGFGWLSEHYSTQFGPEAGWQVVLYAIVASAVMAIILLAFTWNTKPHG